MGVKGYLVLWIKDLLFFYAQLSDECFFTTGALKEVLYSITYNISTLGVMGSVPVDLISPTIL